MSAATKQQTLNLPPCPGIDRNKPYIRAAFGKRHVAPKIEAQNFHGPSCAVLTRTLASVIGGNATESLKTEFHEKEVETVPANVGN